MEMSKEQTLAGLEKFLKEAGHYMVEDVVYLEAAIAHLSQPSTAPAAIPEDMVLVPKEPTKEMWNAGLDAPLGIAGSPASVGDVYRAMIAAAPSEIKCAHCGRSPGDKEYCDWIECAALSPAPTARPTDSEMPIPLGISAYVGQDSKTHSSYRSSTTPSASTALPAARPTDLSKRLRDAANAALPFSKVGIADLRTDDLIAAANEIERYYGGMLAWKRTAEAKDCEALAAPTAQPGELPPTPPLPTPYYPQWSHSNELAAYVEEQVLNYARAYGQACAQAAPSELTDAAIDRVLSTAIPGGSSARDWFLPHEHQKGLENVRDVVRRMIATAAAPTGELDAIDAARWRALLASERIRPLGSAGLEKPRPDHYAHMGLEIWTKFGRNYSPDLLGELTRGNELGREWLIKYADIAIAAATNKEKA